MIGTVDRLSYRIDRHLVREVKNGAIASAADVAVALRAEGGAAAVPAERTAANRTRHEVSRPHSVGST